jgi:hypothetical protein
VPIADRVEVPFITTDLHERDRLSTEAWSWQYWCGSICYTLELLNPNAYRGFADIVYVVNNTLIVEAWHEPNFFGGSKASDLDTTNPQIGAMAMIACTRMSSPNSVTSNGYLTTGTTARIPNPAKVILSPDAPIAVLEAPFCGIYDKMFTQSYIGYSYKGTVSNANASAYYSGKVIISVTQMVPPAASGKYRIMPPVQIRVSRHAGDDFRFMRFIGVPPTYWNYWKLRDPHGAGTWCMQLEPSRMRFAASAFIIAGTAFASLKPGSSIKRPIRRQPSANESEFEFVEDEKARLRKRLHELELGEAQGITYTPRQGAPDVVSINNGPPINLAPGGYAEFLTKWRAGMVNIIDIPCGMPVPTFDHVTRFAPDEIDGVPVESWRHQLTLAVREKSITRYVRAGTMILPQDQVVAARDTLLEDLIEWAVVNHNATQSIYQQINNWLIANDERAQRAVAFSVLNEIQQQISGLEIIVTERPPEGPQDALQWPVRVELRCTHTQDASWIHQSTTGSKHSSKRDAAAHVLVAVRHECARRAQPDA